MITDFSSVDETHSYDAYCHISCAADEMSYKT